MSHRNSVMSAAAGSTNYLIVWVGMECDDGDHENQAQNI
jgi:hypothetical protein